MSALQHKDLIQKALTDIRASKSSQCDFRVDDSVPSSIVKKAVSHVLGGSVRFVSYEVPERYLVYRWTDKR